MRLSSPLPETRGPPRPRGSPFRGFRGHFRSLSLFRRGPRRVGLVFVTIMLITRNGKRLRPLGGSSAEPRSSTLGRTSCRTFETEPAGSTGRSPPHSPLLTPAFRFRPGRGGHPRPGPGARVHGQCLVHRSPDLDPDDGGLCIGLQHRAPMFALRLPGVLLLRLAARMFAASLLKLPPRITRLEPLPTRPHSSCTTATSAGQALCAIPECPRSPRG